MRVWPDLLVNCVHMIVNIFKHESVRGPVEVVTSVERRRRWPEEEKGRIVAESYAPGAVVSDVARRHEMSAQHLYEWRRRAKSGRLVIPLEAGMTFAPVVTDDVDRRHRTRGVGGGLAVSVGGAVIEVTAASDLAAAESRSWNDLDPDEQLVYYARARATPGGPEQT